MSVGEFLDLDEEFFLHLGDPESVNYIKTEQVSPEVIEDEAVREIFEWQIEYMREYGLPAPASVLADEFGVLPENPETVIGDLVSRLRERYVKNVGRESIKNLATITKDDPAGLPQEVLKVGRKLSDIVTKRGEVFGTGDYERTMSLYDDRVLKGHGPSLGFREVDAHFNGQQGVTFLIAAPKTYKSWITIKMVYNNIITSEDHFPYLYSLELPAHESDMRLRCMAADVPYWKFLKGMLLPEDKAAIKAASELMDEKGQFKIEKPDQGDRNVASMVERAINAGASCIFIDQLQYIENRKGQSLGAQNNTGDYFEAVNDLRNYSDEIPIFVVHQFNRSVMGSDEMPEMQQAKGSSAIEEVATLALGLWASKQMRRSNYVELGTLASRNYSYQSWEIGVSLSRGCGFEMLGEKEVDE